MVDRKGSYYYFGSEKLSQGRENALVKIREDVALQQQLRQSIKAKMEAGEIDISAAGDEDPEGQLGPDDEGGDFEPAAV